MIRSVHIPLVTALILTGCASIPDSIEVEAGPENPATTEDLVAKFRVDRKPSRFVVTVTRTGAAPTEYEGEALEVTEIGGGYEYTLTIPARQTSRDQIWTFEGRAFYGSQSVASRKSVTIQNTAPTVTVRLEPAQPTTLEDIRAVAEVVDPDDNPIQVSYKWDINGETFFVTGSEFPWRATKRDDVIKVTVIARDNQYDSEPAIAQVTVANIAPGPAEIAVTPNPAAENGPVTCAILAPATDLDGDPVSYKFEWLVNDVPWTGVPTTTFHEGDTIPPNITVAGQFWTCKATPTDGTADGPTASADGEIIPWAGPRVFTTCGKTGREGPSVSQCAAAYAGSTVEGEVVIDKGVQIWTAPTGGRFRIEAGGAEGGHGSTSYRGGRGAFQAGTVDLKFGDQIHIIVGQPGTGKTGQSGGGGGGTFVVRKNGDAWEPLVIAGGGAGVVTYTSVEGCPGNAGRGGSDGSGWDYFNECRERSLRLGEGGQLSRDGVGAGGGGFNSDGADDYPGWDYGKGGLSFKKGGAGGNQGANPCGTPAPGGFGGGGSGNGCYGGGGGGGYSGGDGGYIGGGGGSFNAGDNPVSTRGGNTSKAEGWVIIDLE
jgi:hypothetical protein